MNRTGQRLWWMLPGLLVWGGCAAGALLHTSDTHRIEPVNSAREEAEASQDGLAELPAVGHSAAEAGERASLGEFKRLARERGKSEAAITGVVESIRAADPAFRPTLLAIAQAMLPPEITPVEVVASASRSERRAFPTGKQGVEGVQAGMRRTMLPVSGRAKSTNVVDPDRQPRLPARLTENPEAMLAAAQRRSERSSTTEDLTIERRIPVEVPNTECAHCATPGAAAERAATDRPPASSHDLADSDDGPPALAWRKQLRSVIKQLHKELDDQTLDEAEKARLEACLGLLHIVAEDTEQAIESLVECRNEQELEFWRQTIMALGILLDSDELPKFKHRVELATDHLRKGDQALSTLGPLRLRNLAFCTKVSGFGDFGEFGSYAFRPGQPVLLYVEVENYTVEEVGTAQDHHSPLQLGLRGTQHAPEYETELSGRYEIVDTTQRTVASRILPVDRNRCRNRRRDYFIPYMLHLPEKIAPGSYTLELTIEDKKGNKFGNGVIDFRVK